MQYGGRRMNKFIIATIVILSSACAQSPAESETSSQVGDDNTGLGWVVGQWDCNVRYRDVPHGPLPPHRTTATLTYDLASVTDAGAVAVGTYVEHVLDGEPAINYTDRMGVIFDPEDQAHTLPATYERTNSDGTAVSAVGVAVGPFFTSSGGLVVSGIHTFPSGESEPWSMLLIRNDDSPPNGPFLKDSDTNGARRFEYRTAECFPHGIIRE